MSLSRRTVIASALAGTATVALPGLTPASAAPAAPQPSSAAPTASPAGDVVGKVTVGYQGWFACKGDGAPINSWWHWSQNAGQPP
ncbi:xylosidase, partial [Streptomyces sp. NPDC088725]